jgi:membrane protease YdiL (CAAX protease family)
MLARAMSSESIPSLWLRMARVLAFWVAAFVLMLVVGGLRGMLPPTLGPLAWGVISSLALLGLIRGFLRFDRRSVADVGLAWTSSSPVRFLGGLALGVATYAITLLMSALALGPIRLGPGTAPTARAIVLMILGLGALVLMEELTFRTYALWTAVRTLGIWPAQLVVAIAFSLLHVAYGWPISTVLLGVFPSAILFGMATLVSGGLALPLGVHLGINVARWMTGEVDGAGPWTLDTSGLDLARAATLAPLIGAAVPLLVALALFVVFSRQDRARS